MKYKYKLVTVLGGNLDIQRNIQSVLNKYAESGWHLITVNNVPGSHNRELYFDKFIDLNKEIRK